MNATLDAVAIEATLKSMREYAKTHFGTPNGPDFAEFAAALSGSKEVAVQAMLCVLMIGISGNEVGERMKELKDDPDAAMMAVTKTAAFQPYAEAVYLGYLLGRRAAEVEALDHIAAMDSKT